MLGDTTVIMPTVVLSHWLRRLWSDVMRLNPFTPLICRYELETKKERKKIGLVGEARGRQWLTLGATATDRGKMLSSDLNPAASLRRRQCSLLEHTDTTSLSPFPLSNDLRYSNMGPTKLFRWSGKENACRG